MKRITKNNQFCVNKHDTFICGRYRDNSCKDCRKQHYLDNKKVTSQRLKSLKRIKKNCLICHKSILVVPSRVNRTKYCSVKCRLLYRRKQFCLKMHDTFILGRDKDGRCSECRRDIFRKYKPGTRPKKQFCINNHDTFIYGRTNRKCNKCHAENEKEYRKKHPGLIKAASIKQQTNRNVRIVAWTDWDNIDKFYDNMPNGMTGDHIIPLQGDGIAGLHVSWNLQYLPPHDNFSKHNKCDKLEASEWYGKILKEAGLK